MAGGTTSRDLLLANHGPGPLTIDDPAGADSWHERIGGTRGVDGVAARGCIRSG